MCHYLRHRMHYIFCMISKTENNLSKIRREKGLLQKELADLSGVELRTIQSYEQGIRDINGSELANILRLASALGCAVSDLLTDETLRELCRKARL